MIGFTKLLCGTATVSEAMRYGGMQPAEIPPQMLQFSSSSNPLVVWNTTRRCNLECRHCYISAEDRTYADELTNAEARTLIDDLSELRVPVLLFSGGEPLMRRDIYDLIEYASGSLRCVISTNGTLISRDAAERLKASGIQYVGISLDGLRETHDRFRGVEGSFDRSIEGIRNSINAGIKTGVRLTLNKSNLQELESLMDFVIEEGIDRFCMYHLVYSGRGREMLDEDISNRERLEVISFLIDKTIRLHDSGVEVEILTTDNHADGLMIKAYVEENQPERSGDVEKLLEMHGGCSAGDKMSNIDPSGDVHPCQFWSHKTLGNVREERFSYIWNNPGDEFLQKMRDKSKYLKGKCGECSFNRLCGGCRIRAETVHGDMWAEDPACYID